MFSKLCKLVTLTMALGMASAASDETKATVADIFDNESEFMRGFETGLFLRSKGGDVEEYGCAMPVNGSNSMKSAFDMIRTNINMAASAVVLDDYIQQGLDTVMDFFDGLYDFTKILSPKGYKELDQYCTGMVFGLQGSKLLVQVANTLRNPREARKNVLPKPGKSGFEKLQKSLFKSVQNTMSSRSALNDEL